jgi:elongation factor Ts
MESAAVSKEVLMKLRQLTGAGMMDCRKALEEAGGDLKEAQNIIRKRGLDIAKKKSTREAKEGLVVSYIHGAGRLGVLVEINCESDFVARNEQFQAFAKDIAMQVAAAPPLFVSEDQMPQDELEREKAAFASETAGKPEAIREKILEGRLKKRYEEICLLHQKFIRDDSKTVKEYLDETIARIGENIVIRRFVRFEVGGSN